MPRTGSVSVASRAKPTRAHAQSRLRPVRGLPPSRFLPDKRGGNGAKGLTIAALSAVVVLSALLVGERTFPAALRIPLGREAEQAFDDFAGSATWLYEPLATALTEVFDSLVVYLGLISPPVLVAAIVVAVGYRRGLRLGVLTALMFAWVVSTDLWQDMIETIAFMTVAVALSAVIGVLLGTLASTSSPANTAVRLLLDGMQAFPPFVYFVPTIVLFGVGNTAAMIVTIVWAVPPIAKMTSLGLRGVSEEVTEAAVSSGAGRRQLLWSVKFPMASGSIAAGLNQTIMYAIAMATMSAMIGADGLGAPVWSGLSRLEFGDALEGGIALVLLAMVMDRATAPRSTQRRFRSVDRGSAADRGPSLRRLSPSGVVSAAVFMTVLAASLVSRGEWQNFADPPWGQPISLREPVRSAVLWMTTEWGPALDAVGETIQVVGLNSLAGGFASIPWFVVVACTAVLALILVGRVASALVAVGLVAIGCLGMWGSTVETLAVVTTAVLLVVVAGFPLGVLMSASDKSAAALRPVLDVMQTMPVYLFAIPAVMIFGTGEVAAVLATVLAALPPMIRFTNAGLRGVDGEVVEAAVTFGATPTQVLRQVRIPMGLPTIMVGLNQTVLIALAMAVVSALIGAPGLGQDILTSVMRVDLALGVEAGAAMFIIGVTIDRLFYGAGALLTNITHTPATRSRKAQS